MSFIPESEFYTRKQICDRWAIDASHLDHLINDQRFLRESFYVPKLENDKNVSAYVLTDRQFEVLVDYVDSHTPSFYCTNTEECFIDKNLPLESFDFERLELLLVDQLGRNQSIMEKVNVPRHLYRSASVECRARTFDSIDDADGALFNIAYELFDTTKVIVFGRDGSLLVIDWLPVISREERDRVESIGGFEVFDVLSPRETPNTKLRYETLRQYIVRDFWSFNEMYFLLSGVELVGESDCFLYNHLRSLDTGSLFSEAGMGGEHLLQSTRIKKIWDHCVHPEEAWARDPHSDQWLGLKVEYILRWAIKKHIGVPWMSWAIENGFLDAEQGVELADENHVDLIGDGCKLPKVKSDQQGRKHSSELLEVLDAAVTEFWKGKDPDYAAKRATNEAVALWVTSNFPSVNSATAQYMARIMRPNKYK